MGRLRQKSAVPMAAPMSHAQAPPLFPFRRRLRAANRAHAPAPANPPSVGPHARASAPRQPLDDCMQVTRGHDAQRRGRAACQRGSRRAAWRTICRADAIQRRMQRCERSRCSRRLGARRARSLGARTAGVSCHALEHLRRGPRWGCTARLQGHTITRLGPRPTQSPAHPSPQHFPSPLVLFWSQSSVPSMQPSCILPCPPAAAGGCK